MRRLVALTARQRRAVALGEERQGEADDEEGRGHDRVAGAARQRERGQPKPERTPTGEPLDEAEGGPQQACDEHGGRERDQRRQEQREVAFAAAARELERDEHRRGERGRIQQAEPRPGSAYRGGGDEDRGADGCDEHGEPEPLPGEDAADEDVTDRGAGALGGDRAHEHRERKPDQRPAEREHARLGDGQQRELPPTRAVPGESAARRREVGTQRHRGKECEGEEERSRLAADDPEPPPGCTARRLRFAELLDGSDEVEAGRHRLQLGPGLCDARGEIVDLPEPRPARSERHHPGVAPEDRVERRRPGEHLDTLGEEEGRRRRPVVPGGTRDDGAHLGVLERVVGGGEEVTEEDAVLQHGLAHLDEAQALGSRNPPFAAEAQHLAARPGARLR